MGAPGITSSATRRLFAAVTKRSSEPRRQHRRQIMAAQPRDPLEAMRVGARLFLEGCAAPTPSRCSSMLRAVAAGISGGAVGRSTDSELSRACSRTPSPRAWYLTAAASDAHVLLGALDEAALYVCGPRIVIGRERRWKPSATGSSVVSRNAEPCRRSRRALRGTHAEIAPDDRFLVRRGHQVGTCHRLEQQQVRGARVMPARDEAVDHPDPGRPARARGPSNRATA